MLSGGRPASDLDLFRNLCNTLGSTRSANVSEFRKGILWFTSVENCCLALFTVHALWPYLRRMSAVVDHVCVTDEAPRCSQIGSGSNRLLDGLVLEG